jgi:Tfp pilus assembly protein PilV
VHTPNRIQQAGFSIMEIVIAMFMISMVLVIYHAASNTVILNKGSKHQEVALRIAASKLETLRTTPFTSLPASESFSDPLLSSLPQGQAQLTMSDYNDRTKQALVVVSWLSPTKAGSRQQVQLETLITRGGVGQ